MNFRLLLPAALVLSVVFGIGCQQPPPPAPPAPTYLEHHVTYPGETLGIIAKWYTGDMQKHALIAAANPGLNPKKIIIGTVILIPDEIVVRRTALPKDVVRKLTVAAPAASSDPRKTKTPEVEPAKTADAVATVVPSATPLPTEFSIPVEAKKEVPVLPAEVTPTVSAQIPPEVIPPGGTVTISPPETVTTLPPTPAPTIGQTKGRSLLEQMLGKE